MRKLSVLVSLLFVLSLTGCAAKYNLSEQDTNLVAESVAGILLNYDYNYREQALLLPKTEVFPTTEPDTSSEDMVDENKVDDNVDDASDNGNLSEEDQLNSDETAIEEFALSEVIGDANIDIQYKGHGLFLSYPNDSNNSYFSLTASKGRQLLVLTFSAKNVTEEIQSLNLMDSKVRFRLNINDNKTVNPLYTVLENSLMFINLEIGPGKEEEAILIFEINPDDVTSSVFTASRDDMSYQVRVK